MAVFGVDSVLVSYGLFLITYFIICCCMFRTGTTFELRNLRSNFTV